MKDNNTIFFWKTKTYVNSLKKIEGLISWNKLLGNKS